MHTAEVEQFLTHLAVHDRVSASSQSQAINALLFFYTNVLEINLGRLDAVRARRGKRLPVVLTRDEVRDVRSIQVLLGHESLETPMAYTHVARRGVSSVPSPLDLLGVGEDEVRAAVASSSSLDHHAGRPVPALATA